jgi:hypothetical protein
MKKYAWLLLLYGSATANIYQSLDKSGNLVVSNTRTYGAIIVPDNHKVTLQYLTPIDSQTKLTLLNQELQLEQGGINRLIVLLNKLKRFDYYKNNDMQDWQHDVMTLEQSIHEHRENIAMILRAKSKLLQ